MIFSAKHGVSGLATSLFFFAQPALAQDDVQQGVSTPQPFLPVDRSVLAILGVSSTYDSNVATASRERAATAGIKRQDVIVTPNMDVDMALPFGRNIFKLTGSANYNFHVNNTQRDGEQLALRSGLSTDFSFCRTELNGRINRHRSNIGDFNQAAMTRDFYSNFENTVGASGTLSCGSQVGLRPFASVHYTRGRNTARERKVSDFDTFSYGAGVAYIQPSLGEVGIVASIERTDYPERLDNSIASGQPGFATRSAGAYFNREIARTLQARIQLNYTTVDPKIGSKSFEGVSGNLVVRLVPGGQVKIVADLSRTVKPSLAFNVDYVIENAAELNVIIPLTPKLELRGGIDYRDRGYRGRVNNDPIPLIDDTLGRVDADLSYKLGRRIKLGLNAGYQWRLANAGFYDFDGLQVGVNIGMTF